MNTRFKCMKRLHTISSYLLAAIGLAHMSFGIAFAEAFNSEIMWFESLGLLLILVGFMNLTLLNNEYGRKYLYGIILANWFVSIFLALVVFAESMRVGVLALFLQATNSVFSWFHVRQKVNCCGKYATLNH